MEYSELVQEIAARVSAYLESGCSAKKKLMILTQEHGDMCHKILESPKISEQFRTECALMGNYESDCCDCAGVVMFNLTNEALARIVSGVCGTPYTSAAAKALLLGKPVWVPKEEIEILRYECSTPYAKMMYEKLAQLESMGVTVCSYDDIEDAVIGNKCAETSRSAADFAPHCEKSQDEHVNKDFVCAKKVITEKDLINAYTEGANRVLTGEKAIVTDLAKEYARAHSIEIVKG